MVFPGTGATKEYKHIHTTTRTLHEPKTTKYRETRNASDLMENDEVSVAFIKYEQKMLLNWKVFNSTTASYAEKGLFFPTSTDNSVYCYVYIYVLVHTH